MSTSPRTHAPMRNPDTTVPFCVHGQPALMDNTASNSLL